MAQSGGLINFVRYTQRIIQTVKSREADNFSQPDKFSHYSAPPPANLDIIYYLGAAKLKGMAVLFCLKPFDVSLVRNRLCHYATMPLVRMISGYATISVLTFVRESRDGLCLW